MFNLNENKQAISSGLAGMTASSVGKTILHPIDTLKAKIQVIDGTRQSILGIAKETVGKEGFSGLYKGLPISILGSIPAAALYFGSYEYFKTQTLQNSWL